MKIVDELYTDVGSARRLAAVHSENVRYVPDRKAWLTREESGPRNPTDGEDTLQ